MAAQTNCHTAKRKFRNSLHDTEESHSDRRSEEMDLSHQPGSSGPRSGVEMVRTYG